MRLAIKEARKNILRAEGSPFGACIVRKDSVLAVARNSVLKNDATGHAEMNAIRKACAKLGSFDLSDCMIFSTTEPCPMCFGAIHWARIKTIVFGVGISNVKKRGFNELCISNKKLKSLGRLKVKIYPSFLRKECLDLLREWDRAPRKKVY